MTCEPSKRKSNLESDDSYYHQIVHAREHYNGVEQHEENLP